MHWNFVSRRAFMVLFCGIAFFGYTRPEWYTFEDLQDRWMVFDEGKYRPFVGGTDSYAKAVYFYVDTRQAAGRYLEVSGHHPKAVFVGGKLISSGNTGRYFLRIDSLRQTYGGGDMLIGIYQSPIHEKNLITRLVTREAGSGGLQVRQVEKPESYYRDFVLVAFLVSLVLLLVLTRLAKLPLRIFTPARLFSFSEGEDTQLYTRIASSTNIIFYVFCSLVIAFFLLMIFRFVPEKYPVAWYFRAAGFWQGMGQWGKLSLFVLGVVLAKITLVYVCSRLFDMKAFFGFHVVNWIRIMLVVFGLLSLVLLIYFISHGMNSDVYAVFFWSLVVVWVSWLIILFAKVARRSGFSLFHIFSYLCVTELIPLLILLKLLYH